MTVHSTARTCRVGVVLGVGFSLRGNRYEWRRRQLAGPAGQSKCPMHLFLVHDAIGNHGTDAAAFTWTARCDLNQTPPRCLPYLHVDKLHVAQRNDACI